MKKSRLFLSAVVASALAIPATISMVQNGVNGQVGTVQAETINQYISNQGFGNPAIQTKASTFTEIMGYENGVGRPEGVVIHDTGNDASTLDNEVAYMQREWSTSSFAYVHAFVDANRVVNIHPTDYAVWGAGRKANAKFIQIELVHAHSTAEFARSVNNDAYYVAYLLKQYGLPVTNATHSGSGTVWAHSTVTNFLGGTDHGDPDSYFARYGYSMDQFFELVQTKYNQLNGGYVADADPIVSSESVNYNASVFGTDSVPAAYLTTSGFTNFGASSAFTGTGYTVHQIGHSKKGQTLALIEKGGVGQAWISTSVLGLDDLNGTGVLNQEPVSMTTNLNDGSPLYYLTNRGIVNSNMSTSPETGVQITSKVTLKNGGVFYLLAKDGAGYAWISAANVTNGGAVTGQDVQTEMNGAVTVNYIPGYGTLVWGSPEGNPSDRYLAHGSEWLVYSKVTKPDGTVWYNLGGNQWINGRYTTISGR